MKLTLGPAKIQCSTERVDLEGVRTRSDFTAAFDGKRYPVTGIPEIATVSLKRYPDFVDADFFSATAPVFSYRLRVSGDGKVLTIISIDPTTRNPLHARLVYRRQAVETLGKPRAQSYDVDAGSVTASL
jgi:hypothetical protein